MSRKDMDAPMLAPIMAARLIWLDVPVADGMATIYSGRPSSKLHWETEKFECS